MRLLTGIVLAGLFVAACSDGQSPAAAGSQSGTTLAAGTPGTQTASAPTASAPTSAKATPVMPTSATTQSATSSTTQSGSFNASAAPARAPALPGRTGELVNPDDHAMIFLYYDLAGVQPPLDQWVEQDNRVTFAAAFDKAAMRTTVRAELESAAAAVRGVGFIRVSMNAQLSDYDPTYGEFSVRALAPSSTLEFSARSHKISVRFGNGRVAQIWRVPPAEAQVIRDKVGGYGSHVTLDALLRILSVQPGYAGGTITTEVIEYEMRETRRGLTIGRVQVVR